MSLGIGHFSLGAAGALLALGATGLHRKTSKEGGIAILSGLWALIPDIGLVFSDVGPTDHTPLANLFWFHYTLDTNSASESIVGNAMLVGLMGVALVWYFTWDKS